jgi:hypothetical protein
MALLTVTCVTCEQVLTNGRCTNELCPGYVPRDDDEDEDPEPLEE